MFGKIFDSNEFLLLQVNDSLFPIGGYSHSFGLETYIDKGLVTTGKEVREYLERYFETDCLYTDLLGIRLAFEAAKRNSIEEIWRLEELLICAKTAREPRSALLKMGSRFLKTVAKMEVPFRDSFFSEYAQAGRPPVHITAYGVFCASLGVEEIKVLSHYLYAKASAMVTVCVKTIPLSQTQGQQILSWCCGEFPGLLQRVEKLGEMDFCRSSPGLEIRCMQHEGLYSRLYMS